MSEAAADGAEQVEITVDGRSVRGPRGRTIAGLLLAAGVRSWRTTAQGAPRGVFCGIGVCFDCLVEVNGVRDVRACARRARDGDVVVAQRDGTPREQSPRDEGRQP